MARKTKKQLREARIDAMLFFVLAEMFPKQSDTMILDIMPEVKKAIKEEAECQIREESI